MHVHRFRATELYARVSDNIKLSICVVYKFNYSTMHQDSLIQAHAKRHLLLFVYHSTRCKAITFNEQLRIYGIDIILVTVTAKWYCIYYIVTFDSNLQKLSLQAWDQYLYIVSFVKGGSTVLCNTSCNKRVQICFIVVNAFIQLLNILHTNLFTFIDLDFVHSSYFIHIKAKSGAVKFLFNSTTGTFSTCTIQDLKNCIAIFINHLLKCFCSKTSQKLSG